MRVSVLVSLAVGLFLAANHAKGDASQDDVKKMEGTWIMASGEQDGKKLPEETVKSASLTIKGNKHTVKIGDETIVGTHKVDASKKPKAIDASDTEGPFKGKTTLGIYEVDGDTFKVCFAGPDKDRPKEFTIQSGTGTLYHVWKRKK